MKKSIFLFTILLSSIFGYSQLGSMSKFIEATPVYKYTNSENIEIFEVSAYGTNSIDELGKNAKFKLLNMLVFNGYNGIKNFKPISVNSKTEEKYKEKIENILNNSDIISSDYKKAIKPIFISKRKIYTKTFLIGIDYQKLKSELQNN
jgi:hypothetical protein